ncbi:MAG: hypothetical protein JW788_06625 [Candidatus Omnitrophica bacterium]|nr:hypothetical protein [Candidatus Omnitrophota bacterium]
MAKKEEILKDLKDYLVFEEDIIDKLSSFYLALGWKNYVQPESEASVKESLVILKNDTKKHIRIVSEMIEYLDKSGQDEF